MSPAQSGALAFQEMTFRDILFREYLNGYVSKLGSEYGIPTPLNDSMVDLVNWTMARGYRGRAGQ